MTQSLIQQLQDASTHRRSEAALELGKLASPDVVEPLVNALLTEDDLNVQEDITWALSRLGEPVVPHLIAGLEHESADVRHKATHALGKLGNGRAVSALRQALVDNDPRVRYKATVALGQIGDRLAVPALIEALADDHDDVCTGALESLAHFGDVILPQLMAVLPHTSDQVCEAVASLLGESGDKQAVIPLIEALPTAQLAGQLAIIQALGQLGDKQALATLEACLEHDHPHVRIAAKHALKIIETAG